MKLIDADEVRSACQADNQVQVQYDVIPTATNSKYIDGIHLRNVSRHKWNGVQFLPASVFLILKHVDIAQLDIGFCVTHSADYKKSRQFAGL
ncbi:MAG: hypothetical protein AAF623_11280 [Planctomycetota bacterium]